MAGNRCGTGEAAYKKQRAIQLREKEPELTVEAICERLNVPLRTMKGWLAHVGEERADNVRGLSERERRADQRRQALEMREQDPSLSPDAIAEGVGVSVRAVKEWLAPAVALTRHNEVIPESCPESL